MKANIYKLPFGYFDSKHIQFNFETKGYIEMEKFDRDECWHLCNWSCWSKEGKPNNLFSDLEVVNSDVIFHDEVLNKYHLAEHVGWHTEKSIEKMLEYCFKKKNLLTRGN
jgi:hypothetical protein